MTLETVRRISKIAALTGAGSYLEIGVQFGETFLNAPINSKVGVDPNFRFEWRQYVTEHVKMFELTSDQYFTSDLLGEPFDIVFLDGLHTFEQTFRDFCASLSRSHGRTVWLLDDTVPSDAFSAIPNQSDAIWLRKEIGIDDRRWHGDVYKTIFAIHDFFPQFSFATIVDGENPQSVVWHQPRTSFAPMFNNMELISRLSYLDSRRLAHVMLPTSEEDTMSKLRTRLKELGPQVSGKTASLAR
jgi:hypothetical protein